MNEIDLRQNQLTLKEKRGSLIARLFIYLLTIFVTALPLSGLIANITNGGLSMLTVFIYGIFGLIAFYMLRVSLWNTYGAEIIHFEKNKLTYTADYRWFKDGLKEFDFEKIDFSLKKIGYDENNKAVLVIKFDKDVMFETVSRLPLADLEDLITNLTAIHSRRQTL